MVYVVAYSDFDFIVYDMFEFDIFTKSLSSLRLLCSDHVSMLSTMALCTYLFICQSSPWYPMFDDPQPTGFSTSTVHRVAPRRSCVIEYIKASRKYSRTICYRSSSESLCFGRAISCSSLSESSSRVSNSLSSFQSPGPATLPSGCPGSPPAKPIPVHIRRKRA